MTPSKTKPDRPYPGFPLFPHAVGKWAKKIGGKLYYFGQWDDPVGALAEYQRRFPESTRGKGRPAKPCTYHGLTKPPLPYPDFPLYAHSRGQWAKSIRGRTYYFGKWDDPQQALANWLSRRDDLMAGRAFASSPKVGFKTLCNHFVNSKKAAHVAGELTERTLQSYLRRTERVLKLMGDVNVSQLTPQVFEKLRNKMAETMCPVTLKNHIAHVRSIFRYAQDQKLIAGPISFGQRFKKPTQKTLRKHRLDRPKKMFTADQIKMMVADAPVHLKAMILLGINCGFGNTDCATVSIDALGLDTRWFDFARQKTAVERWGPLWDETVAALRDSLAQRPTPASDEYKRLFFLRDDGQPWILCKNDYVTLRFRNLLKRLNVYQEFVGFYSLRHTFFTKAEDYGDPKGAHFIMGHLSKSDDMAPVYREEFSDERLRRITDYVHDWIWGK